MDACLAVEREGKKVAEKFHTLCTVANANIERTIALIQNAKDQILENQHFSADDLIQPISSSIRDSISRIATEHRDLHSSVSKVGKAIDRNFVPDLDSISRDDVFSGPAKVHLLNQIILQHLYRKGHVEVADHFAQEAGIDEACVSRQPFNEINFVLTALRDHHDLKPALEFVKRHQIFLHVCHFQRLNRTPSLAFKLHELQFIQLLRQGDQTGAVAYARSNLVVTNINRAAEERQICNLMGAVMYARGGATQLASSPYAHLLRSELWTEVADMFLREACAVLGLSVHSPLDIAINAGCIALPALLNIKQVMLQRQVDSVFHSKDELPIEINLGLGAERYHSVFACPILRQQTTELNPPMRLVCGHCISRDALTKLSVGHKLKCPYCPVDQNPSDARQVTF